MKSILCVVVALLFCAGSVFALDREGLVLYLPFDEGSGKIAKDASGNKNDGQLQEKAEWVKGKFGQAIHLSAPGDYVKVSSSDSLNIEQNITMAIWANVDSLSPDPYCSFITKCTADNVGAYMLHVDGSVGAVAVDPLVFINNSYAQWPSARATVPFGEWHHIAASYDGNEYKTYIDGKLEATFKRSPGGKLDHSDAPVAIGRDNRYAIPGSRFMDCIVDEAMIFSRVLSNNEIKQIMAGGKVAFAVEANGKLATTWAVIKAR